MQWVLTSCGGTVGSLVAFGINVRQTGTVGVSNAVYIVFIVIMLTAIVTAFFFIVDPRKVVRDDGTHIAVFKQATVMTEVRGLIMLFTDVKILLLIPAIFVAEMCLALMSSINAYYFNLRTRSLNNVMFEFIMIPCPLALAWIMDTKHIKSRRSRGLVGVGIMGTITLAASAGLTAWIKKNNVNRQTTAPPGVDWTDPSFGPGFVLYLLFGIVYATYQICVQWVLASLTNDPSLCARYAGFFKGTTSLGMCISFVMDAKNVSYMNQLIVQFVLYAVGLTMLIGIIWHYVADTNYFKEDDVIVPHHIEEEAVLAGIIDREQLARERAKERLAETERDYEPEKDAHQDVNVNEKFSSL